MVKVGIITFPMVFTFSAYRDWMNPVPPPSIYVDDKFYEITIDPATSLDSAGKIFLFIYVKKGRKLTFTL